MRKFGYSYPLDLSVFQKSAMWSLDNRGPYLTTFRMVGALDGHIKKPYTLVKVGVAVKEELEK